MTVNNGGTVLAASGNGDPSASSAALQSSAESDVQDAAVASLVSGSPIGILPESLVNCARSGSTPVVGRRTGGGLTRAGLGPDCSKFACSIKNKASGSGQELSAGPGGFCFVKWLWSVLLLYRAMPR